MIRSIFILLLATALASPVIYAQGTWRLTTADFKQRNVDLISIDDNAVSVRTERGESMQIPVDHFLQLERSESSSERGGKFILALAGGDQIVGQPASVTGDQLHWNSTAVGDLTVPIRQIESMQKIGTSAPSADDRPLEDIVRLANGDVIKGIVTAMDGKQVSVQVGNDVTPAPLDTINSIRFASASKTNASTARGFRIKTTDSSSLVAQRATWQGGQLNLALSDGGKRTLDGASVVSIEQINGPVSWLSSRQPSENIQIPYLGEPWPARMDKTVRGEPIRFGDKTFTHGIGVHSYSRISYPLDGTYKAFHTAYAIDGDLPYADVTVRIKLDGQVVHEVQDFRSGVINPVTIELKDAKLLTLEVDYGKSNDTQDRLNWIEPALLKNIPTTNP